MIHALGLAILSWLGTIILIAFLVRDTKISKAQIDSARFVAMIIAIAVFLLTIS